MYGSKEDMARSTLTSKGQITIPKEIRSRLGLRRGDQVEFRVDDSGEVRMKPARGPAGRGLAGLLAHRAPTPAVSVAEMRAAIGRRAASKRANGT